MCTKHDGPEEFEFDIWYKIDPENNLTGVSYRSGAGDGDGKRPTVVPYVVNYPDHWIYYGTGLQKGDKFGGNDTEALIGYEADGAQYSIDPNKNIAVPTGEDGTPSNYIILAYGKFPKPGEDGAWGDYGDNVFVDHAATMGIYQNGGVVFNSATVDWARVLVKNENPILDTITKNVLNGFGGNPQVMSNQEIILRLQSAIAKTSEWTELVNELNILIKEISDKQQYIIESLKSAIARTSELKSWTALVNELNILIDDLKG